MAPLADRLDGRLVGQALAKHCTGDLERVGGENGRRQVVELFVAADVTPIIQL